MDVYGSHSFRKHIRFCIILKRNWREKKNTSDLVMKQNLIFISFKQKHSFYLDFWSAIRPGHVFNILNLESNQQDNSKISECHENMAQT